MMRVRPYYLYQCDPISGSAHFRTTVQEGLEIIRGLRGHTTGYAVPTYVIDAPGGGGKIPLQPDYVVGRDGDDLLAAQLHRRGAPLPGSAAADKRTAWRRSMRIGLTYDLRDDYLAMGYGEEETAEFDRISTIEAIEGALQRLGPPRPTASATRAPWPRGWWRATAGTWSSTSPRACPASAARPRCRPCSTCTASPTPSAIRW